MLSRYISLELDQHGTRPKFDDVTTNMRFNNFEAQTMAYKARVSIGQ